MHDYTTSLRWILKKHNLNFGVVSKPLLQLQVMIQQCRAVKCDVYTSFLDYSKAFDLCNHERRIHGLRNTWVDENDIKRIVKFYGGQRVAVLVEG